MADMSPETIELLERAQRAIEEAQRLRAERERLVDLARPRWRGYYVSDLQQQR
jgi:hypothetical protein